MNFLSRQVVQELGIFFRTKNIRLLNSYSFIKLKHYTYKIYNLLYYYVLSQELVYQTSQIKCSPHTSYQSSNLANNPGYRFAQFKHHIEIPEPIPTLLTFELVS